MTVTGQIYLVSGATRGIGAELVKQLVANPANKVIAAVRNIQATQAKQLATTGHDNLIVIQIDSEKEADAEDAAKLLVSKFNLDHVDVVIANAGISPELKPMYQVGRKELHNILDINVCAPLQLFQAFRPLLEKSTNPRFIAISSLVGSFSLQDYVPYPAGLYGTSKAALNFIIHRLAREHPNIVSFVLHPGLVATDMAAETQRSMGKDIKDTLKSGVAITTQTSAQSIIEVASHATTDLSGKLWDAPGKRPLPF